MKTLLGVMVVLVILSYAPALIAISYMVPAYIIGMHHPLWGALLGVATFWGIVAMGRAVLGMR
jgi:hypothetical protein